MVDKSELFFNSFTNKKGITKLSANFTIDFAKRLADLEEDTFKVFIDSLKNELENI